MRLRFSVALPHLWAPLHYVGSPIAGPQFYHQPVPVYGETTIRELARLWPYLLKPRRPLVFGFVALVLTNVFALASPWILRLAIDDITRTSVTGKKLLFYAFLVVLTTGFAGIARYFMRWLMIGASRRIEYEMRNDFYAHLTRLPASFYQRHPTGELMALATNDLNAVRNFLGPGIMQGANTIVTLVSSLVLMFILSPKLTLGAMIPMPLLSGVMGRFGRVIHARFEAVQQKFCESTARAQEYLAGVRVVKAYAQEKNATADFDAQNVDFMDENMRLVRVWGLFYPSMAFLAGAAGALVLYVGGVEVMAHRITLGDFVAFNTYLVMLIWPMIALGWVVNLHQRGAASMARLGRVMDEPPEIADRPGSVSDIPIHGEIEFRNVTFDYPGRPGQAAINAVSLRIPAGSTVALVGHTGSGKSTLVHLIPRLYDPTRGEILLDGRNLRDFSLTTLRRSIGFVPQESFLFSQTLAENIALGAEEASERQIQEMSDIVRLSVDVEEFPDRFETLVGERGVTLSGGQKQRAAIARAILREPSILILDDALSSVDTKTEEEILKGLTGYMKTRTTILVSHRVSTVRTADQIVVFDGGRIVEQGTHDELMARGGRYRELERLQRLREELESAV